MSGCNWHPRPNPVCTLVAKLVTVDDFSIRPARGMTPEDVLKTGKYCFRFYASPHIPHGWDAGVMRKNRGFARSMKLLNATNPAWTSSSRIVDKSREVMRYENINGRKQPGRT